MREQKITTPLGEISVKIDEHGNGLPIVFLHGVFLDHTLWTQCDTSLTERPHIYIDMPAHGASSDVSRDWSLDECTKMLFSILDEMNIRKVIAIGHSWGSMTILRAATKNPSRFAAVGLFNMPFKRTTGVTRIGFTLQKQLTVFPRFYAKQAAKSLYTKDLLSARPDLVTSMQERLSKRPPREIARVIDAVILKAEDTTEKVLALSLPALAVIGESDYVPVPPKIETITVPGGHVTPDEAPTETRQAIQRVVGLAGKSA